MSGFHFVITDGVGVDGVSVDVSVLPTDGVASGLGIAEAFLSDL